jgi:hypothetical protein
MLTCKFFDFPQLPHELVTSITPGKLIGSYPTRSCVRNGQKFLTSLGEYFYINSDVDHWVREHVPVDVDFVGIRYQYGCAEQSSHGAHCDATREYALLYTLDHADGYLQFWQDPEQDIELNRGYLVHNYDNLTPLQQYQTPNHTWYLVNGQIIHSVENLTRTRVTLQVNLKSPKGIEL